MAGTSFAVWAPNAQRVSVVGTFNNWDGRYNSMRSLGASGVWEIFIPGLGEGTLYTRNAGQHHLYWQGPSIGPDIGGTGDKVMMLVYNLPAVPAIYDRFPGVQGTAHVVAGFGMTVVARDNVTIVPIISGIGARLGVNVGYLKFTDHQTFNPL